MNSDDISKLRQFYSALVSQQKIFDEMPGAVIRGTSIIPLENELRQLNDQFPSLPFFDKRDYFSHVTSGGRRIYSLTAIRSYLAILSGRVLSIIQQSSDAPVTENRQFAFVTNFQLRNIVERDYSEVQRAYISGCWKSVIVLCGGAVEAILTDLLASNETAAKAAHSVPKSKSDLTMWDLSELIEVALELTLVSAGVQRLSHSVREYRDLIHPGREVRKHINFGVEEAKIALEVLNILHRELSH